MKFLIFFKKKYSGEINISSLHPTELARQLALIGKTTFDKIDPSEYTRQSWSKSEKLTKAPHIVQMISLFNLICNWASSEVLRTDNIKERAVVLNRLIIIAEVPFPLLPFPSLLPFPFPSFPPFLLLFPFLSLPSSFPPFLLRSFPLLPSFPPSLLSSFPFLSLPSLFPFPPFLLHFPFLLSFPSLLPFPSLSFPLVLSFPPPFLPTAMIE